MQFLWNTWRQFGRSLTSSPPSMAVKHTTHSFWQTSSSSYFNTLNFSFIDSATKWSGIWTCKGEGRCTSLSTVDDRLLHLLIIRYIFSRNFITKHDAFKSPINTTMQYDYERERDREERELEFVLWECLLMGKCTSPFVMNLISNSETHWYINWLLWMWGVFLVSSVTINLL